jgi:hypothetical protein
MPTATYIALANLTLTTTDSEVVFSSIPASFRDLVLVVTSSVGDTGAPGGTARNLLMRFNSDTTNHYTKVIMSGDGTTARALSDTQEWVTLDWYAHSNNGIHDHIAHIMDYSATDKHKTTLARARSTNATEALVSRWPSTNAITSISVFYSSNTLASGSTFALYGIVS